MGDDGAHLVVLEPATDDEEEEWYAERHAKTPDRRRAKILSTNREKIAA